jgi:hypothetical protein
MLLSGEADGRGVVGRRVASSEAEFDIHSRGGASRARRNFARGGPSPSSEAKAHLRGRGPRARRKFARGGRGPRAKRRGGARASALDGEARATVGP